MSEIDDFDREWTGPGVPISCWRHKTLEVNHWGGGKWSLPENKRYSKICKELSESKITFTPELVQNAGPWREAVIKAVMMGKVNRMGDD